MNPLIHKLQKRTLYLLLLKHLLSVINLNSFSIIGLKMFNITHKWEIKFKKKFENENKNKHQA